MWVISNRDGRHHAQIRRVHDGQGAVLFGKSQECGLGSGLRRSPPSRHGQ
jgi:hypothetical protein